MSSTLLEVTRAAHEEVERLERLIVKDLQNDPPTTKDRLFQSHRVHHMIDTITTTTEKLVNPSLKLIQFQLLILVLEYLKLLLIKCLKFCLIIIQVEIYEDKDNARKDEIAALGGQTAIGTNVFSAFYDRLKEVY